MPKATHTHVFFLGASFTPSDSGIVSGSIPLADEESHVQIPSTSLEISEIAPAGCVYLWVVQNENLRVKST